MRCRGCSLVATKQKQGFRRSDGNPVFYQSGRHDLNVRLPAPKESSQENRNTGNAGKHWQPHPQPPRNMCSEVATCGVLWLWLLSPLLPSTVAASVHVVQVIT
jgi:hypothetical protein